MSIGELAQRTHVPAATLRSWEARYGLPHPQRLAGGHRRYAEEDVALVEEILRHRATGLSMDNAVNRARVQASTPEPSVFAGLRRRNPELIPQVLRKSTVLALSRSIEDECCAQAENPILFGSFQRDIFYHQSRSRWVELARTSRNAVVFADFPGHPTTAHLPVEVSLPPTAPLLREWVVVCDAPDYPACLAAWEHPGQHATSDVQRRFETVWSVDPGIVRDAARICANLAEASAPRLAGTLVEALTSTPLGASADLRRASGLLNRMVAYLESVRTP